MLFYRQIYSPLAWDNIDRLKETLSGGGSSHRVNGIAIQAKIIGPQPYKPDHVVPKTKKRSIDPQSRMMPIYNAGAREGPPKTTTLEVDTEANVETAQKKNLLWTLARMSDEEFQSVSGWTGFNILTRDNVTVIQDNIGYLPTVNAPATQMSTVYEVLNQSVSIMQSLQLTNMVCVFDQAMFSKAIEIVWKHQEKFNKIIVRLGVFHTICSLLSIIGKRFQDAGLRDLCVESGVIAEGSIAGVMDGHKYNRSIRLHKLVYEAFMRMVWKGFLPWLELTHGSDMIHLDETLRTIKLFTDDICNTSLKDVMEKASVSRITGLFQVYLSFLRDGNGCLSTFWMSYVDMVEMLLGLVRASREGDWLLHLACIKDMIPWYFAYDKIHYGRYLPIYYAQMTRLPVDNPEVYDYFMNGGFSVQIGQTNPFGRIPVDQTIEETVNRDTQTAGGTKGFSLNPGAISRYYHTAEYRTMYLRQMREMTGVGGSQLDQADLHQPRIQKDEKDVRSLLDLIENSWINPLSPDPSDIVNLSTGILAPEDITDDLLKARRVGEEAYQDFKSSRLEQEEPTVKFHDKLPKQKLKTFSNMNKKTVSSSPGRQEFVRTYGYCCTE